MEDTGGRSRRLSLGPVSLKTVAEVRREGHARKAEPAATGAPRRAAPLFRDFVEWQLAEDKDDELPIRFVRGPIRTTFAPLPRRRREMVEWLKRHPEKDDWQDDDWRQRCRDDFPTTACALCALARDGSWPADRWREALQAWSEERLLNRSWHYVAPIVAGAPDDLLQAIAHSVAGWLRDAAKTFEPDEALLFGLCRRLLALDYQGDADEDTDGPVFRAINHPVGHVVDALLNWWYRRNPEDGQRLPELLEPVFTEFCDAQVGKFRHGRVVLASHTVSLFRVDREWATKHLLPLFDWGVLQPRRVPPGRAFFARPASTDL